MEKVFKIAVFGLALNEQKALVSIFKLGEARNRKYKIVTGDNREEAEIILVDVDNPKAVAVCKNFLAKHKSIPIIKVTKSKTAKGICLHRPLTLKRVLEILDKVTIEVLKFVPELVMDDNQVIDDNIKNALQDAVQNAQQTSTGAIKALVVDDAAAVRKAMEIHLGIFGMAIDFAETGEEALEFVKKKVYDIIFLDLMLPGIDGYQVCKTIKSHKTSKNTPVIMLTGKGGRFDKIRGTMAGASVFLTKPVQQEQLQQTIREILPQVSAAKT